MRCFSVTGLHVEAVGPGAQPSCFHDANTISAWKCRRVDSPEWREQLYKADVLPYDPEAPTMADR